jgi:hypothetical protein
MKNYTILGTIIIIVMAILIEIGGFILFELYRPIKTIEIDNPIKIVTDEYKEIDGITYPVIEKNGDVVLEYSYTKYINTSERTFRTILCEDGNLVTLTDIEKNMPTGTNFISNYNGLTLPEKTSVNTLCKIEYLITYEINHLRPPISVPTKTELFYVMDKPVEVVE